MVQKRFRGAPVSKCFHYKQESPANAKVRARQQCAYEGHYRINLRSSQRKKHDVEKYIQRVYLHSFSRCRLGKLRNPAKFRQNTSRSPEVIDLGANRKRICDFLSVINSNFRCISYHFRDNWALSVLGARDVIGHSLDHSISHFLLVVLWNQASTSSRFRDIQRRMLRRR